MTNIIVYHEHCSILQCIWKPCRDHSFPTPMRTWAILVILVAILDLASIWPPDIHQKRICRPKISGIRCITQVFVLHWSKSRNSTNPRWPPDAIFDYKNAYIENDGESSVLDSRHLQATFLKKITFLEFFSISKSNAPGLVKGSRTNLILQDYEDCFLFLGD